MSIPDKNRQLPLAAGLLCVLTLGAVSVQAASRPPTIDPTYGLPLPVTTKAVPVSAGNWIWTDKTTDAQTIFLRRAFRLTAAPKTATLYITADDFFTLFVNGKQVDRSQPDPKDNNLWQHVHQIDLAPYLTAGTNVLAIRAVNAGSAAGVIARLEMPGQTSLVTDGSWKVLDGPTAPDGWNLAAFDEAVWRSATIVAPIEGGPWSSAGGLQGWPGYNSTASYLAHLSLPFAAVADAHPGAGKIEGASGLPGHLGAILTVTPPPPGATDPPSLLLDFGQEVAGRVLLDPLTAGTVLVGTGESDAEAIKSPWGGQHLLTLAAGEQSATPYSAFRYARLVFPPGDADRTPTRLRVILDHKYYPVQYKGSFDCSDPLLTKLWYTGAYTSHLCMQEDIWDAPKRDRARWIGDLHVSGRVIDTVFADKFLMEQTMQRLRDEAQGGAPAGELPKSHVNGIPGYSCA